jgi:hypothetical protein
MCDKIHLNFWYLSHPTTSKTYKLNSIKSCSSRSFQQHRRHIPIHTFELNDKLSSVTTFLTDFFFSKSDFFGDLFEFSVTKNHSTFQFLIPILSPNLTKYILLNLAPQDLSNNNKEKFTIFVNFFSSWFNLIFNEKITQYSKTCTSQVQMPWN